MSEDAAATQASGTSVSLEVMEYRGLEAGTWLVVFKEKKKSQPSGLEREAWGRGGRGLEEDVKWER